MKLAIGIVAAVLLAQIGTAGAGLGSAPRPTLGIASRAPLVVRGSGFTTKRTVAVTATAAGKHERVLVVASRTGTFVARFDEIRLDACTGAVIVATARSVELARLKIGLRECPGPVIEP